MQATLPVSNILPSGPVFIPVRMAVGGKKLYGFVYIEMVVEGRCWRCTVLGVTAIANSSIDRAHIVHLTPYICLIMLRI